uniref:Peptidase C1A propeptide domain-containing protein n=1 Tax=Opuntia streptacantha TaxID=393608 RepID=A0A7C9CZH3_OPUST
MKLFVILTVCMYAVHAKDQYVSDTLKPLTDEMIKAINALNTTWKAGKNFAKSPLVELDKLVVTHEEILYDDFPVEVSSSGLATQFDARTKWPNCTSIGKIFDQKKRLPWMDLPCCKFNG